MSVKAKSLEELEHDGKHIKLDWKPATHRIEKQLEVPVFDKDWNLLRQVVEEIRDELDAYDVN